MWMNGKAFNAARGNVSYARTHIMPSRRDFAFGLWRPVLVFERAAPPGPSFARRSGRRRETGCRPGSNPGVGFFGIMPYRGNVTSPQYPAAGSAVSGLPPFTCRRLSAAVYLGFAGDGGSLILSGGGFGRNSDAGTPTTLGLVPVLTWGGWAGRTGASFCAGVGFFALAGPVCALAVTARAPSRTAARNTDLLMISLSTRHSLDSLSAE